VGPPNYERIAMMNKMIFLKVRSRCTASIVLAAVKGIRTLSFDGTENKAIKQSI
jgi:hypothetical protein